MKTLLAAALLASLLLPSSPASAQVGIGTTTPDTTSVLDVSSATKALVIPRLSATAIAAIQHPVEGSVVYNTTARRFFGYGGTAFTSTAVSQATGSTSQTGTISTTLGQSFTVASTGYHLASIDVFFNAGGSPNQAMTLTVRSGAGFSGPVVATASAATPGFASSAPVTFSFAGGSAFLAPGVYTLCVETTSAGNWILGSNTSNPYAGGTFYNSANQSVAGTDLYFVVRRSDAGWKQLDN